MHSYSWHWQHVALVALFALLFGAQYQTADAQQGGSSGWRLIYAVDSTGARVSGDKAQVLAAVRGGQPIRVGWGVSWKLPDGTVGGVEHVAEAAFVTIHRGEVFAQMPAILGQTPAAQEASITFRTEGDHLWYALLDTTGRLRGYFTGGSAQSTTPTATYWYTQGGASGAPARLY